MSAMWWAEFDGHLGYVEINSGGGRSMKPAHLRHARTVAKQKAREKAKRLGVKGRLISIQCVG